MPLATLALLLVTQSPPPTAESSAVLEVNGARAFAASPGGDLWICSRDGHAYVSHDWNRTWREVEIPARKPGEFGLGGDELEHLCFFDAKRAILAGYIGEEEKDSILRTEDGGLTWTFARLPITTWVYDAQVTPDGHAWLVGSTGKLLASNDFGATWTVAGIPFDDLYRAASVYFSTPQKGVVGALINAIKVTADGGKSWVRVPTPADVLFPVESKDDKDEEIEIVFGENGDVETRPQPPGHKDPVERVWIVGDQLVVRQREQVFRRSLATTGDWKALELDGHKIITAEKCGDDLVVVDDEHRVSVLSANFELKTRNEQPLEDVPLAIASGPRGIAMLTDVLGKVCVLADGSVQCSRLMSVGADRKWQIASFDRSEDGTLFGASSTAIYRSKTSGRTWERLAEGEHFDSVCARADGSGFVLSRSGTLCQWSSQTGTVSPIEIPGRADGDLDIVARKGRLWIAKTFDAAKDAATQRMLHTSDTVLVGPEFTALVFASSDEGRTWKEIDRYVGAIVHATWLASDGTLSLCMSDHSIRQGKVGSDPDSAGGGCIGALAPPGRDLGGQWATWLAFPEPLVGWVGGSEYFGGAFLHRTQDGGRTWPPLAGAEKKVIEAFLLGAGGCVRVVGFWHPQSRAEIWRDGKFEVIRTFESPVHDASVDATGCLLVRLENAEVWSLDRNGVEWGRLGTIALPPR